MFIAENLCIRYYVLNSLAFGLFFRSWDWDRLRLYLILAKVVHSMLIGEGSDERWKSIYFWNNNLVLNWDKIDFQMETVRMESWSSSDHRELCYWLLIFFSDFNIIFVISWSILLRFTSSSLVSLRFLLIINIFSMCDSILYLFICCLIFLFSSRLTRIWFQLVLKWWRDFCYFSL